MKFDPLQNIRKFTRGTHLFVILVLCVVFLWVLKQDLGTVCLQARDFVADFSTHVQILLHYLLGAHSRIMW